MLIIKDQEGNDKYGIIRDSETHYEIMRWSPEHKAEKDGRNIKKGDHIDAKWISAGQYPSSLAFALQLVYDMMLAEDIDTSERGLKAAITHAKGLRDYILEQVDGLEMIVEKKAK